MNSRKLALIIFAAALVASGCKQGPEARILVFSKTEGFRHESIPDAHQAIGDIGYVIGARVDSTEQSDMFNPDTLEQYDLVIFALTSGDVLDDEQQAAFELFIREGGAFVGIHSASDTEYDWPWYAGLVGGYFDGHPNDPNVRRGRVLVDNPYHPSTSHLRFHWYRDDEWYDIRDRNPDVNVLLSAVDSTYKESWSVPAHPVSWYHYYDGGRSFYTALGHTSESYHEAAFVQHLRGGIEYALGRRSIPPGPPPETDFTREIFADSLNEPMELEVLPDGRILFIERPGRIRLFEIGTGLAEAGSLAVTTVGEDGLLGLALDPGFKQNEFVYLYYSPIDTTVNRLSRFRFDGSAIDLSSESTLLEVPVFRGCCHSGGSIEFDRDGNLYLATGDDTNPFESAGYSPHDDRPGRDVFNAQRTSANTNDLRGKVLRIRPEADGSYSIPEGNLTDRYEIEGRPEVYTMGHRNPFRISIDHENDFLYWGDIGPDADGDTERGPRGYDEVGQAREAGNFGWPYFIADNQPYRQFDFTTNRLGDWFDASSPVNNSPLNTGSVDLPPARPALIWYPYRFHREFTMLADGGRSAMAGPVFRRTAYHDTDIRFPRFYDGKLFVYDWMRHWIKTVTFDRNGDLLRVEPFLPSTEFNRPVDMVFGPDGAMYLLEYGTKWSEPNPEARLSRISYRGRQ